MQKKQSILDNQFNFYRKNYSVLNQFDSSLSKKMLFFLYFYIVITLIIPVHLFLKLFVNVKIRSFNNRDIKCKVFVFSKNHTTIFNEIRPALPDHILVDLSEGSKIFSNSTLLLFALSNRFFLLNCLKEISKDKLYKSNSKRILKLVGLDLLFKKVLLGSDLCVKFNDHNLYSNHLIEICLKYKVKTIYIQHAPISNIFPELHHDLNVLFSKDSYDKYSNSMHKNFFLACDFRFPVPKIKHSTNNKSILICTNKLDNIDLVEDLCNSLSNYKIVVRPHPSDIVSYKNFTIKYEVSKGRSIWDDLSNCSHVVTNESSVILEAAYFNKQVYKASFFSSQVIKDNYNFLKSGLLIKEFKDSKSLIISLESSERTINMQKLSYFIGDINSKKKLLNELKIEITKL